MIIYGEYLFLENFITGVILLMLTGKLLGKRLRKGRIFFSGVLCGAAGFSIFCNWSLLLGICLRIIIGAMVVTVAFGDKKINSIIKQTAVFVLLTFLSGGAAMAILIWYKEPMLYGTGAVYMAEVTYIRLVIIGAIAFGGCYGAVHIIKERRIEKSLVGDVCAKVGSREFVFSGYLDSGNHLREPISGKPVILIDREGQKVVVRSVGEGKEHIDITDEESLFLKINGERLVVIPYRAIGTDSGMLKGFRTDYAVFKNVTVKGAIVGLYNGKFDGYQALVGKDFIDGEEI